LKGAIKNTEAGAAPRSRIRRWGRRLAKLCVGALLLGLGLYLTRAYTLHPMLTRVIAWGGPRFSAYDVSVGEIAGD